MVLDRDRTIAEGAAVTSALAMGTLGLALLAAFMTASGRLSELAVKPGRALLGSGLALGVCVAAYIEALSRLPAFVHTRDLRVEVPGCASITVDIAYGGNFFALVRASELDVELTRTEVARLIERGVAVRRAVADALEVHHPKLPHTREVRLTAIYERPDSALPFARTAVVFGEGQLDRSPCGTGTSALMATLHARGELPLDVEFVGESVIGTRFRGRLERELPLGEFTAVAPIVTGTAHLIGLQRLVVDPADPLKHGFILTRGST